MAATFIFGGDTNETPEGIKRKRELVRALMSAQGAPRNVGEGLNALGDGIVAAVLDRRANAAEKAGRASADAAFAPLASMFSSGANSGVSQEIGATSPSVSGASRASQGSSALPASFLTAIDSSEGAGAYDTLFGHAQRNGPFAGTDVSRMTIGEAIAFADPSGPYAQHVKGKIGRVATPMGRHQIIGTTLRKTASELGLDPSTPFNAQTQDMIAAHLARQRISGANTLQGKISALREEWHGLRNVPDAQVAQIVKDLESGGNGNSVEVASLDKSAGYVDPMVSAPNPDISGFVYDKNGLRNEPVPAPAPPSPIANFVYDKQGLREDPAQTAKPRQQVAQALTNGGAMGQDYFPPAPQAPQPGEVDMRAVLSALNNPFLSPGQRAVAEALLQQEQGRRRAILEQQMKQNDPKYRLDLEKGQVELDQLRNPRLSPADEARIGLDREKFDFEKQGAGLTDDIREYNFYADQVKAAGGTPMPPDQFWQTQKRAGAQNTNVTVGTGEPPDGELRKALDKGEGDLWTEYKKQGAISGSMAQDFQVLDELMTIAPQGPITGRLAEAFPGFSSAGDAFQSVVKRIAPTLRAPGSGATSDIEYDGMLRSLPALRNAPEGNRMIGEIMKAKAALNMERADVITRYQTNDISAAEARRQIAELDKRSIMSPQMKQALEGIGAQQGDAGDVPEGVDPEDWKLLTPEERKLWQN